MPALILESRKESSVFGFVGDCLSTQHSKDIVAAKIEQLITEFKPHTACWITTGWTLDFGEDPAKADPRMDDFIKGRMRVKDQPDRIEVVSAYCYGEKGENEGEVLMLGYIQRFKNSHPKIKRWRTLGGADDVTAEGTFPEAVKSGFQKTKGT